MEFQSGQNCVTEIKGMLCAKYIKTLCYIENIHKCYAQNAEMCSKCRNVMLKMHKVMLKMQRRLEFQSGQNCVTEIKHMLCAKYIKALCYIENTETSCAKCMNIMCKIHKRYAQNAETLCSKCRSYAQNVETLCSKCRNVMLTVLLCILNTACFLFL